MSTIEPIEDWSMYIISTSIVAENIVGLTEIRNDFGAISNCYFFPQ